MNFKLVACLLGLWACLGGPAPTEAEYLREAGIVQLLANREAYRALSSYRCRMTTGNYVYDMAYSGSKYRIDEQRDGEPVSLRTFDGETFASMGIQEMVLRRGTRAPSDVPMTEPVLNLCFRRHDVVLDHFHDPRFLEKDAGYVVDAKEAEWNGQTCLVLESRFPTGASGRIWCSQTHHGFPLVIEEYSKGGSMTLRQEVVDHELVDTDAGPILFPLHLRTTRPGIPGKSRPGVPTSSPPRERTTEFVIDRNSLQINPEIPLSEFQIDASLARTIIDTDRGKMTLGNGNTFGPDLQRVRNTLAPEPPPAKMPWLLIANAVIVVSVALFLGYRQWRS